MLQLRSYQTDGLQRLSQSIMDGRRRPLVQAPTGAGKTVLAAAIVQDALAKGKRVAFCAPVIELINQTCDAFEANGIAADALGVVQASHWRTRPHCPVQVCSLQTIDRRGFPEVDIAIIDEAHEVHKVVRRWMEERPDVLFIGLTATPWAKGLGRLYDALVIVETVDGLIARGYLAPLTGSTVLVRRITPSTLLHCTIPCDRPVDKC